MLIWACFKEMHHKTLCLWQLFVDKAYEKEIILLIQNHFCVDSPAWEVWWAWGVLTGNPVGPLLSPFLPGENFPVFTDSSIRCDNSSQVEGCCRKLHWYFQVQYPSVFAILVVLFTGGNDFYFFFHVALVVEYQTIPCVHIPYKIR